MISDDGGMLIPDFMTYTIGIVVYFAGMHLNRVIPVLRAYNIPEPVTGGLLAAFVVFGLHAFTGLEISFDLQTRNQLLVYFFTAIGLNARFSDLVAGGRPLGILLGLTVLFIVVQNIVGVGAAAMLGQPMPVGILVGSASLIGGHGTAIAWAPEIAAEHGVPNAMEIGVAAATLGLVVASLLGGPTAKFLLHRFALSGPAEDGPVVGISHEREATERINHISIMSVLLTLHIAIILGFLANAAIESAGLKLPLFVTCLLVAIIMSNTVPVLFPRMRWPAPTAFIILPLVSAFFVDLTNAVVIQTGLAL